MNARRPQNSRPTSPDAQPHSPPGSSAASPADKSRLSENVYESLLQMILAGELQPGQSISEVELSRRLDVSRTPVHEAVGQLVKDGLVAQPANRRPVVISFSSNDVFDVYEMRRILETEAAAKAATRMDLQTLQELLDDADSFEAHVNAANTLQLWIPIDDRFHTAIANASGSRRLAQDVNRYRLLHRVFNRTHTNPAVLVHAAAEHREILQALKNRNPDTARMAMQKHLEEWQRFFVRHLSQFE